MITASKSQTSVSDNNLVKTSFKNGIGLVETTPGCSRSRAPHLRYILLAGLNSQREQYYGFTCEMTKQRGATSLRTIEPSGAKPQGQE